MSVSIASWGTVLHPRTGAVAAACVLILSLNGCGGSPSNLYKEFRGRKAHLGDMAIMMDYILIEGLMGDTSKIDLIENRRMGASLLTVCADSLSLKGYPIRKTILSSIGLLMKPNKGYRVVRG